MNEDIDKIVTDLKSRGSFDEFRKECLSCIDTLPPYANLTDKIDLLVRNFFSDHPWDPSANKNQLRDQLRQKIAKDNRITSTIDLLVKKACENKAGTITTSIAKYVDDYLGIKVKEPLLSVTEDGSVVWSESKKVQKMKQEEDNGKWSQGNWQAIDDPVKTKPNTQSKSNPSLSASPVSSDSISPPTPEPITEGGSGDSFPPAPSPTSLISGDNSKSSQHYFDESTSKSPAENKTKNDIWNQLSKEGKQSADEPKPEPLDWGKNNLPPPERPFAHLGSSATSATHQQPAPTGTIENFSSSTSIKCELKSPELPSSSSSVPLLSNKSKEESREEMSEIEESKGKIDAIVSDLLSDVSSAHTSDLSDFADDAMSISSVDDVEEMRKETDEVGGKTVQSEGKTIISDIKVDRENASDSQVNEQIVTIKVEEEDIDKVESGKDKETKTETKDVEKDLVNEVDLRMKTTTATPIKDRSKTQKEIETKKRKESEKEIDPWNDVDPKVQVKPKFEIIKSTPEAPVFDIRARGTEAACLTPEKSSDRKVSSTPVLPKEVPPCTTIKTEKPLEAKSKFVIPKIKREPKSRDLSPSTVTNTPSPIPSESKIPSSSTSVPRLSSEESKSKRSISSKDSNKKKSDLSNSQRYDESDLYKPRYSIPGGSRRHRSSK